ncbi:MAG: hypothetical protein ABIH89_03095 [Elusimicrobiota bacterium]
MDNRLLCLPLKKASSDLFKKLEDRDLLMRFSPPERLTQLQQGEDGIDTLYISEPEYGSHKLACIGKNTTEIKLASHPDNEEFILVNPTAIEYKPLILIVGLYKHPFFQEKAEKRMLDADCLVAIEMKYNDPGTSFFTMLKNTPHWEVTMPGTGPAPVFFVTEPAGLQMPFIDLNGYSISIDKGFCKESA